MPIIRETSNLEKITLLYKKGRSSFLRRTDVNSLPSVSRKLLFMSHYKHTQNNKFKSNKYIFHIKFDSSLPKNSLSMETVYLNRRSQMVPFSLKKVSRKDLEKILKWGIFYDKNKDRFTVPCAGGLYHYEIYLCLFRSHLLPLGLYRYNPQSYTLGLIKKGCYIETISSLLFDCFLDRLRSATGIIFLTSDSSEVTRKYDYLSERTILLDIGHLMHSMNLSLTASGYGVSNILAGGNRNIISFLGETKRANYIASMFFGGKNDLTNLKINSS